MQERSDVPSVVVNPESFRAERKQDDRQDNAPKNIVYHLLVIVEALMYLSNLPNSTSFQRDSRD